MIFLVLICLTKTKCFRLMRCKVKGQVRDQAQWPSGLTLTVSSVSMAQSNYNVAGMFTQGNDGMLHVATAVGHKSMNPNVHFNLHLNTCLGERLRDCLRTQHDEPGQGSSRIHLM